MTSKIQVPEHIAKELEAEKNPPKEESKIPYSKKKGEILDILRLAQALQIRFRGSYKTDCKIV